MTKVTTSLFTVAFLFTATDSFGFGSKKMQLTELKGVTELGRHKLVFGAEYQRNLKQDQTNYLAQPFTLFLDFQRSSDQVGLCSQDDIALTQKRTLSTGFRYDS